MELLSNGSGTQHSWHSNWWGSALYPWVTALDAAPAILFFSDLTPDNFPITSVYERFHLSAPPKCSSQASSHSRTVREAEKSHTKRNVDYYQHIELSLPNALSNSANITTDGSA